MRVRILDANGDWTFGNGIAGYVKDQDAVAANLSTLLKCFAGDCFFDAGRGVDYFNLLGSKNEAALLFSIKALILSAPGIASVEEISATTDEKRNLTVQYEATSIFGIGVSGVLTLPATPYTGISKFVDDITFTGQTFIDVDVSSKIRDAYLAVWIVYDVDDGYSPVIGAVLVLSSTTVRVTILPPTSGVFRLVGIA